MEKCKLLKQFNENLFDDIYLGREEKFIEIKTIVKNRLLKENIDLDKKYDGFINSLRNLKDGDEKVENAIYRFNLYFEEKGYKDGIINEEFYKRGVKDGINLVINALCSE